MSSIVSVSGRVVRPALPSDYTHFVRLFPELGTPDPTPTEARFLSEIVGNMFVVEVAGEVVAYTYFQTLDDAGYVRHVVVTKAARRAGHARALLEAVRSHLVREGRARWCLNVVPDNVAAVTLYKSMGMTFRYDSVATRLDWSRARTSSAVGIDVGAFAPDEDAAIERAFALPTGQISDHRTKEDRVFLKATKGTDVLAFTVFDRSFPGTYPLRVRDVDAGWKLFESVRTHARPEHDHIRSFVEESDAWRDALVDAGADILLRVSHYEGAI